MGIELSHNSNVTLYEQMREDLRVKIREGIYERNAQLPTEEELSEMYGVSRITVRRAIADLCEAGLIEKRHGKGTFVSGSKLVCHLGQTVSFTELCRMNGVQETHSRILEAGITTPEDLHVRDCLGLQEGERAVHIARLRFIDNRPILYEDNYFPMEYADLLALDLEHISLYEYLRNVRKQKVQRTTTRIRIVKTDVKMAKLLDIPKGAPRMELQGSAMDSDTGKIVHTSYQLGFDDDFVLIV